MQFGVGHGNEQSEGAALTFSFAASSEAGGGAWPTINFNSGKTYMVAYVEYLLAPGPMRRFRGTQLSHKPGEHLDSALSLGTIFFRRQRTGGDGIQILQEVVGHFRPRIFHPDLQVMAGGIVAAQQRGIDRFDAAADFFGGALNLSAQLSNVLLGLGAQHVEEAVFELGKPVGFQRAEHLQISGTVIHRIFKIRCRLRPPKFECGDDLGHLLCRSAMAPPSSSLVRESADCARRASISIDSGVVFRWVRTLTNSSFRAPATDAGTSPTGDSSS